MLDHSENGRGWPEADVVTDPPSRGSSVQQAVETFVALHSSGQAPDPATFAANYPEELRAAILDQCREFLSFDGLLGPQLWESAPAAEQHGRPFGDFLIQEELGRGGMGVVYLAVQQSLKRRVALKVMASGLTLSKRHVERFRREAEAAARLRHPAIVPVHSLTEVDGTFALAMDYVAGRNLADVLDDLRLANGAAHGDGAVDGTLGIAPEKGYVAECAMLAAQVASALAAAHQAGVVHRDLKPRNLMLDDRRQVRLLDFGLAKSLDAAREGRSISLSGEITGTAHYMSPEQTLAKRVEVDHRADIWALGVILYELLTLRRPFDGKNLQQIVYEICFKEPVPLQRRNPKVPRDLVTIVQKALEKDPQNRYQAAAEFEADLLRFLRWEPIHARPASRWSRLAKFLRRHRTETAIGTAVLLALLVVLGVVGYRGYVDGRRADSLLLEAEQRAEAGDFLAAADLTNRALELRNDAATRERLKRYYADKQRIESDTAGKVIESRQLLEHDREAALRLALEAERQLSSAKTRSAVLDALGSGWAVRTLATPPAQRVVAAGWSPDGTRIATAGYGGLVQLFAADADGAPLHLRGHAPETPVLAAAFAGDDRLVTTGPDRTLRVWRAADGGEVRAIALPGQAAMLRTDATGARALVVTYGSPTGPFAAQVFDTATGAALAQPVAHDALIVNAALSPDGQHAATCARGVVRLWRVADGAELVRFDEHVTADETPAIAFAPDSAVVAVAGNDGHVRLYGVPDGRVLGGVRHPLAVTCLAFDGAGQRLLTGSRDRTARLWQLERTAAGAIAATEAGVLIGHGGPVQVVAFDRSDQLAVTGTTSPEGTLRLFDVGSGRAPSSDAIRRYEVGAPIDTASFDAESRRVLAVAGGRALVWDFGTARGVVTVRQPGAVPAACFVGDGARLVTAGDDERLRLWHTRDGRQGWTTGRLGNPIEALDVDRAGDRIACGMVGGRVQIHRVRDGAELYRLDAAAGDVAVVRFAGDGSRLLTAGTDAGRGAAVSWNTNDWSAVHRVTTASPIVAADLAPDGELLATVEKDAAAVRLWHLPDGDARGDIRTGGKKVHGVRFAPDGETLLLACDDGGARIVTRRGELVRTLGSNTRVHFAAFSPDGGRVLTASIGRNVPAHLWRTADASEEILHFDGHRGTVEWATFSADGAWAATSARDGTTCIWPTDPVATARRLPQGAGTPTTRR